MSSASSRTGRGSDQFLLRLPEGLRTRVKEVAETNRRSMNSEIIYQLERSLAPTSETQKADAA